MSGFLFSRRLPSLKLLHSRTIHDQSQSPTENVRVKHILRTRNVRVEPLFRTSYGGTTNDIHICRVKTTAPLGEGSYRLQAD